MYAITTLDSGLTRAGAAVVCAAREVDAAIEEVEAAASALAVLAEDARWQSEGVRMLRTQLLALQSRAEDEIGTLHIRAAELERMTAS